MTEAGCLETLKRVEDVAVILTRMEDINVVSPKGICTGLPPTVTYPTPNRMARTSSLKGRNWMNGNGAIQSFHKGNWKDRLL